MGSREFSALNQAIELSRAGNLSIAGDYALVSIAQSLDKLAGQQDSIPIAKITEGQLAKFLITRKGYSRMQAEETARMLLAEFNIQEKVV